MARDRRNYTDEFKQKMVELYNSGKPRTELVREYELTPSVLSSWIKKFNNTGSFHIEDNRSENNYGTRKIKVEMAKRGHIFSKRRIERIMKENGLVSSCTVKQYKIHKSTCNSDDNLQYHNHELILSFHIWLFLQKHHIVKGFFNIKLPL